MKKLNQVLSVVISAVIAVTSAPWQAYALETAGAPDFVKTFTPPTRLGYMENYFKGANAKPVILIEDLHANFGVQKKIIGLLKFIQPNISSSDKMIIGMENAWKNYDLSYVRSKELPVRAKAMNVLLKEAVISGPEYFATMAPKDIQLTGVDDAQDKQLSLELTRQSFQSRLSLSSKVEHIRAQIQTLKSDAPHSLKTLWHAEADYQSGKIGLDVLAREMGKDVVLSSDKQAEEQLMARKLELAAKDGGTNATMLKNLVVADQTFNMFSRLLRQQMTLEEVEFSAQHAQQFLNVIKAFLPNEDLTAWKEAMNTAVDYYSVALVRNAPLAENTAQLVAQNPDTSIVLVTGGFHTAGIAKILERKNISYMILSPVVESHTSRDEMLYIRRILGEPLSDNEMTEDLKVSGNQAFDLQPTGLANPVPTQQAGDIGRVIDSAQTGKLTEQKPDDKNDADGKQKKLQPVATPIRDVTDLNMMIVRGQRSQITENVQVGGQTYILTNEQLKLTEIRSTLDGSLDDRGKQELSGASSGAAGKTNYYLSPSPVKPGAMTLRETTDPVLHQIHISRNTNGSVTIVDSKGNKYSLDELNKENNATSNNVVAAINQALAVMGHGSLEQFLDKHGVSDLTFEFAPTNALEETFFDNLGNGQVRVRLSPSLITNKNPNAMFVGVAKALVNIETPDKDEDVTLPRFFQVAAGTIGLMALQDAYRSFSAGGQPFVQALDELIHLIGKSDAKSQKNWFDNVLVPSQRPAGELYEIVKKLLDNPLLKKILYTNVDGKQVMRKLMPVMMEDGSLWSSPHPDKVQAGKDESVIARLSGELTALLALDPNHAEADRKRAEIAEAKRAIEDAA